MKIFALALTCLLLAGAFGCGPGSELPAKTAEPDDAVVIRLDGVVARQYSGSKMRFEIRMGSVVLNGQKDELDANGPVKGILFEPLWQDHK